MKPYSGFRHQKEDNWEKKHRKPTNLNFPPQFSQNYYNEFCISPEEKRRRKIKKRIFNIVAALIEVGFLLLLIK